MKRKKVLVHGTLNSLQEFLQSPFSNSYEVQAILNENGGGGGSTLIF